MNIRINDTNSAINDSQTILKASNTFESIVSTLSSIKTNFESNWDDSTGQSEDRNSIIKSLGESISYYQNKIIPALSKLGHGVNAYAIATEQIANSTVEKLGVSPLSSTSGAINGDTKFGGFELEGFTSPATIDNPENYTPGEIDAYIYERALSEGLTEEQAKIAVSISRWETGHYSSNRFVNGCNFGGIRYRGGLEPGTEGVSVNTNDRSFLSYNNFETGVTDFVKLIKQCGNKGSDTIAAIGTTYCNGEQAWINGVSAIYNERFVNYTAKV